MRIGIVCYPSVGGSGIVASGLGDELAARGHEVHFISYERPFRLEPGRERVWFHPVEINGYELFKYPDYTLPLSVKLADVARTHELDLIHAHYAVPHATAAVLAREMMPPGKGPAVITTLHGTDTTLLGRDPGYAPAIRFALESSEVITAVSEYLRQETHRLLGVAKDIEVIPNFFAPRPASRSREAVREELGVGPGQKLVVHLSNLRPLKRVDVLLNALAQLRQPERAKVLILAGGSFTPYQGLVDQLGLGDMIEVRESVAVIEDYLQAADFGLFTSDSESFCLSVLEVANFGCPSVATAVGGIPEVVSDNTSALLVPAGNSEAVARAIERLLGDEALTKRLGEAARERALKHFCPEAIVPHYEALYRRVLEKRKD